MNFGSPSFAYLLFILPLIALLKIAADARGQQALQGFATSSRLLNQLLGGASKLWSSLHFGLQLLGIGFFIIALTRPQLGEDTRIDERTGRNIFIAIDTSKSMLANDVTPNRLSRAKLAAQDLLEKLPNDRVGVIAFAGRAYLQAPLTNDHEAVIECIQSLDHTTIPRGGSSLAAAIQIAVETIDKVKGKQHGMILFTDGQETDDASLLAAQEASKKGLIILPVGVGTAEGSLIPDPEEGNGGGYQKDENGNVINSRLESPLLQQVAKITGGEYIPLASQALTQKLMDRLLAHLDRETTEAKQDAKPIERYQWPLFLGIVCIGLSLVLRPSSRRRIKTPPPLPVDPKARVHHAPEPAPFSPPALARGLTGWTLLIAASTLASVMTPSPGHAAAVTDLERAREAYELGRYEAARNAYLLLMGEKRPPAPKEELAYGLGASQFHLKDYEHAVKSFSDALPTKNKELQKQALRGLGTALYNQGDLALAKEPDYTVRAWIDSLNHFDSALDLDQSNVELKANRDFIRQRLRDLQQQMEQKKQQQQKQKKGKEKKEGQGSGDGEPEEGEEGGDPKDPKNPQEQKKTDAMEKQEGALPEGDLRAGESGKPDEKKQDGGQQKDGMDETKQNDKTGFSPQEARNQLRNYANDQQSVQYLQRREQAHDGKDY